MWATQLFSILMFVCSFVFAAPVETLATNTNIPVNGTDNAAADWQPTYVRFTTCPSINYWPNGEGDYCVTQTTENYACASRNGDYPGPHLPQHIMSIPPSPKTICWVYRNDNCYDFDGNSPLKVEGGMKRLPDEFADNVRSMKCQANF